MLIGKRGILLKETLYLILSIILIVILLSLSYSTYNLVSTNKMKSQALGSLENLQSVLNSLEVEGWTDDFVGYAPLGWWLVTYPKGEGFTECFSQSCACVCDKADCSDPELRICKPITKDLVNINKGDFVKTELISSITITNAGDKFEAFVRSYPVGYEPFVPSSNTGLDKYLSQNYPWLEGFGGCIAAAEKEHQVPAPFILAVTIHESGNGTSRLSQESCSTDLRKSSNNLFGVKGTGDAGFCKSITAECVDDTTRAEFIGKIATDEEAKTAGRKCNVACGEKECILVWDDFASFYDKCGSITAFAEKMRGSRYNDAIERNTNVIALDGRGRTSKITYNLKGMARDVRAQNYSNSANWAEVVGDLAVEINKELN